jgi:cytochrome c oxidase subunit 4
MERERMSTSPQQGTEAAAVEHDSHGGADHYVLPFKLYLKVYGALLVLTYLTVHVSYMSLGTMSLPTAMMVAVVKAGLVVGFFMHLKYDVRFNSFVFFSSILFVVIFFSFTMLDLTTRGALLPDAANFAYERERAEVSSARAAEEFGVGPLESAAEESAPSSGH